MIEACCCWLFVVSFQSEVFMKDLNAGQFRWVKRGRGAFTLAEVLVVIGIIVIVAALAVPAINVLSGSRSIDGAQNVVSAMLSRARSEAMARQQQVGLAIFEDADKERTGLALVVGPQPWQAGVAYQRGDYVRYTIGAVERFYLCHTAHTSRDITTDDADRPPAPAGASETADSWSLLPLSGGNSDSSITSTGADMRRYRPSEYVSILPESDVLYLPPGIGAQVLNSSVGITDDPNSNTVAQSDRYLASSVIFFNPDGRMAVGRRFGIMFSDVDLTTGASLNSLRSSRLGLLIKFNVKNPLSGAPSNNMDPGYNTTGTLTEINGSVLTSGLGVVLYDRQSYASQNAPRWDTQLLMQPYSPAERTGEDWLDANGTVLMLNRFNGSLFKTE